MAVCALSSMSSGSVPASAAASSAADVPKKSPKDKHKPKSKGPNEKKSNGKGQSKKPQDDNAITRPSIMRLLKQDGPNRNWLPLPGYKKKRPVRLATGAISLLRAGGKHFLEQLLATVVKSMDADDRCTVFPRDVKFAINTHFPSSNIHRPELLQKAKRTVRYMAKAKATKVKKDKEKAKGVDAAIVQQ